ncbi:hypothetical protein U1Q18_017003 [Sarracenia purpurea var. burkii]
MLSLGGFPPAAPPPLCNTITHRTTSHALPFPTKTYRTQLSFLSHGLTHHAFCPVLAYIRSEFCVSAVRNGLLGRDDFDYDDEDDEEGEGYGYGDGDGDGDDEEDEEVFVPLRNMKRWLENKPRGFGEGKAYDTSIEDKLLDEMEQSREAQLVNVEKLKNNPENSNSKKGILHKQRAHEDAPSGIRVRLANLPKKKNIHRDLQLAFEGVPGIVNIIPAVSGNKKTRDPICKGFAFIDLKSEEDANRFIQIISRQSVSFGKIQKQIICEIMNSKSPSSTREPPTNGSYAQLAAATLAKGPSADFDIDNSSLDSQELFASDELDEEGVDERVQSQWDNGGENLGSFSLSKRSIGDTLGTKTEPEMSAKQNEIVRENEKKLEAKRKRTKVPKWNIPGSANRLKVKEKAVLTGVLSKYAVQAASSSKEQPFSQ